MSKALRIAVGFVGLSALQGCDYFKSNFDRQVDICIVDIKRGLGDPDSFELISAEKIMTDAGTIRATLDYTAKNAFGGRIRKSDQCGFKTKDTLELDKNDPVNFERELARALR
ncbi:hypothetical protein D9M70_520420 [compost metagenome]